MADQRTEYVVLRFPPPISPATPNVSAEPGLRMVGRTKAANGDFAIREIAEREGAGQYVAIPARSWIPRTVEVATVTHVSFAKDAA